MASTLRQLISLRDGRSYNGDASVTLEKEASAETEAVREFVDAYLTDEQKMIYQRVMIEGESMAAVARDIGVTR